MNFEELSDQEIWDVANPSFCSRNVGLTIYSNLTRQAPRNDPGISVGISEQIHYFQDGLN